MLCALCVIDAMKRERHRTGYSLQHFRAVSAIERDDLRVEFPPYEADSLKGVWIVRDAISVWDGKAVCTSHLCDMSGV